MAYWRGQGIFLPCFGTFHTTIFSVPRSCRQKALLLRGHISPHPVIKKPQTLCVCRRKQVTSLALSLVLSGSPVVIKERANGPVWEQPIIYVKNLSKPALTQKKSALSIKAWHKPTPILAEQRSPVAVCANELVLLSNSSSSSSLPLYPLSSSFSSSAPPRNATLCPSSPFLDCLPLLPSSLPPPPSSGP